MKFSRTRNTNQYLSNFFDQISNNLEVGKCNFNTVWRRNLARNILTLLKFSLIAYDFTMYTFLQPSASLPPFEIFLYLTKLKGTSQLYFFLRPLRYVSFFRNTGFCSSFSVKEFRNSIDRKKESMDGKFVSHQIYLQ